MGLAIPTDEGKIHDTDWHKKWELAAAENERLRIGIAAIQLRTSDTPHIIMSTGETVAIFCRNLLIGPTGA